MVNIPRPVFLTPLIIAAAISVIAFGGIGVAAITGYISITKSGPNPFLMFSFRSASYVKNQHDPFDAKEDASPSPARFGASSALDQIGRRAAARKVICQDCGVVESIIATQAAPPSTGIVDSASTRTGGAVALRDREARTVSHTTGFIVNIQMENGTARTIREAEFPPFSIGERIKFVKGSVVRIG